MWEFSVALILIRLYPGSLLLVSAYGLADNLVRVAGGAHVGAFVDRRAAPRGRASPAACRLFSHDTRLEHGPPPGAAAPPRNRRSPQTPTPRHARTRRRRAERLAGATAMYLAQNACILASALAAALLLWAAGAGGDPRQAVAPAVRARVGARRLHLLGAWALASHVLLRPRKCCLPLPASILVLGLLPWHNDPRRCIGRSFPSPLPPAPRAASAPSAPPRRSSASGSRSCAALTRGAWRASTRVRHARPSGPGPPGPLGARAAAPLPQRFCAIARPPWSVCHPLCSFSVKLRPARPPAPSAQLGPRAPPPRRVPPLAPPPPRPQTAPPPQPCAPSTCCA
jgi:hypothetical protein